jgi:hypothetical protein
MEPGASFCRGLLPARASNRTAFYFSCLLSNSHLRLEMALSSNGGTVALSSWGFGVGDVVAMVGAGRAVGTWLMAQHEDRGLLNLLGITPDDVLRRKGLIDIVALHHRWGKVITLLKNGHRIKTSPHIVRDDSGVHGPPHAVYDIDSSYTGRSSRYTNGACSHAAAFGQDLGRSS